jgi:RNA polymerase sigma-70 factor, ECF subfamily
MPTQRAVAGIPDDREAGISSLTESALVDFVEAHYDRLVRLALLICTNPADAGDAVQRGLERAWSRRATLRDESRLRPWLDKVIVREAIRGAGRPWYRRLLSLDARVGWLEPTTAPIAEPESFLVVRAAFDRLSAEQRAAIALHLYAGYSVAETAELVAAPVETVRSRLRLGKYRLRTELAEVER